MKKILLKLNMVVVFLVVLFANFVFAGIDNSEHAKIIDDIFSRATVKHGSLGGIGVSGYDYIYLEYSPDVINQIKSDYSNVDIDITKTGEIIIDKISYSPTISTSAGSSNADMYLGDFGIEAEQFNQNGARHLTFMTAAQRIGNSYNFGDINLNVGLSAIESSKLSYDEKGLINSNVQLQTPMKTIRYTGDNILSLSSSSAQNQIVGTSTQDNNFVSNRTIDLEVGKDKTFKFENDTEQISFSSSGYYQLTFLNENGEKLTVNDADLGTGTLLTATNGDNPIWSIENGEFYTYISKDKSTYTVPKLGAQVLIKKIAKDDGKGMDGLQEQIYGKIASGVEVIITRVFLAMGDVFLWAIRGALGGDLSIDSLVFNRYEGTRLTFFSGGQSSVISNKLIEVVNYWYKSLSNFTIVIYIIILLYIGIMIIVTSGTPRQDKAKAYFADWIVGLVILMFLPYYGFPFLFKINDALVERIGRNSNTFQTYYNVYDKYGDEVKELNEKKKRK